MAAPNIGSVVASLKSCKLDRIKGASPLHHTPTPATQECDGLTVELNSDSAFPHQLEQCLDMKTGKIFYVNWKNSGKATEDPPTAASITLPSYSSSEDSTSDSIAIEYGEDVGINGDVEDRSSFAGDRTDYGGDKSSIFSSSLSHSSPSTSESCGSDSGASVLILVVAGCKSCFMYFMVPKGDNACPKCGGCLLHLGSN